MSQIDSVRIGDFDETLDLEKPIHWRNILETNQDEFAFIMNSPPTAIEVAESEIATDIVFRLDIE